MKPLVLDWALLSEVDSAVFVWLQPQLVIQNLLFLVIPTHAKLHWCIPWSGKKSASFWQGNRKYSNKVIRDPVLI